MCIQKFIKTNKYSLRRSMTVVYEYLAQHYLTRVWSENGMIDIPTFIYSSYWSGAVVCGRIAVTRIRDRPSNYGLKLFDYFVDYTKLLSALHSGGHLFDKLFDYISFHVTIIFLYSYQV